MKTRKPTVAAPDQEVLTLGQAALFLQVCPETVAKYAKRGTIPGRKIGSDWRFRRTDLLSWISNDAAKKTA